VLPGEAGIEPGLGEKLTDLGIAVGVAVCAVAAEPSETSESSDKAPLMKSVAPDRLIFVYTTPPPLAIMRGPFCHMRQRSQV
jgi:hypothetical protein